MDIHETLLNVVVLDTETGRTASDSRWSWYWWTIGNGSCDCNRELLFDPDALNRDGLGICLGCKRYIVIEVDGKLPPEEFNEGYPEELLRQHLPVIVKGV